MINNKEFLSIVDKSENHAILKEILKYIIFFCIFFSLAFIRRTHTAQYRTSTRSSQPPIGISMSQEPFATIGMSANRNFFTTPVTAARVRTQPVSTLARQVRESSKALASPAANVQAQDSGKKLILLNSGQDQELINTLSSQYTQGPHTLIGQGFTTPYLQNVGKRVIDHGVSINICEVTSPEGLRNGEISMVGSYGGYTHTGTERNELNRLDDTPIPANYYLSSAELELSQQVSSLNLQNRPSANPTIDTSILNSMRLRVENNERVIRAKLPSVC